MNVSESHENERKRLLFENERLRDVVAEYEAIVFVWKRAAFMCFVANIVLFYGLWRVSA